MMINPTDSRRMQGWRIPATIASINALSVLISAANTDSKSRSDSDSCCDRNCSRSIRFSICILAVSAARSHLYLNSTLSRNNASDILRFV